MNKYFQAIIAFFSNFVLASTTFVLFICRWPRKKAVVQYQPPTLATVAVEENASFDPSLQVTMRDIVTATNNFSADQIIDSTSFASVYKAELAGGRNLTVKRLHADSYRSFAEFRSELEILGNLRHRNIVRMVGYCLSGENKVLIYDFFERGSLDICLRQRIMPWEMRVKVVRGVANGLAHMHGLEKPIIHRSMNPKAILLGPDFEAHIDDFGLARLVEVLHTHVSTDPVGPISYAPPEYFGYRAATTKGDVYSFGVLMLTVACGECPGREALGLVKWAQGMASQNRELEMLDPSSFEGSISRGALDEAEVKKYFRVALMCVHRSPKMRPTMMEVAELLKE